MTVFPPGASIENELFQASPSGDLKKVKELIEEKKFDPLQREDQVGTNPLQCSARFGLVLHPDLDLSSHFRSARD
jgi:hypothetical protein